MDECKRIRVGAWLLGPMAYWAQKYSLHLNFNAIAVDGHGQLLLRTTNQKLFRITAVGGTLHLEICRGPIQPREFHDFPRAKGSLGLRAVIWKDGSKAYLDPRGMLHLVSSDTALPQFTLVLCDASRMPGWSSKSQTCGYAAFHPEPFDLGDDKVFEKLLADFVARLP